MARRVFPALCLSVVVIVIGSGQGSASPPARLFAAISPTACTSTWQIVPSPNNGTTPNILDGVTALASNDAWAVGYFGNLDGDGVTRTLAEHWNGSFWSIVSTPNTGAGNNRLTSVAAIAANDVWAVGWWQPDPIDGGPQSTLVEHWNGTAWSVVPSPNHGTNGNYLQDVSAASPTDIWAVGGSFAVSAFEYRPLVERWNGTQWSIIPFTKKTSGDTYFAAALASSPSQLWAVGTRRSSGKRKAWSANLTGGTWTPQAMVNPGKDGNYPLDLAGQPTDFWAVGDYLDPSGSFYRTLVERFSGSTWSLIPSADVSSTYNQLSGVALIPGGPWAAGFESPTSGSTHTLIEHFDGATWNVVASPNTSSADNVFLGLGGESSGQLWAVGFHGSYATNTAKTLVERACP